MNIKVKVYVVTKVLSGIPADVEVYLSENKAVNRRDEIESEIDKETDSVGIHETHLYLDIPFIKEQTTPN